LNQTGFGLVILIALIAITGIFVTSTALFFMDATRDVQLKIDKTKAYYLAQAGVMRAIYNWRVSHATVTSRTYSEINATVTGNQIFKAGGQNAPLNIVQANFAYYTFNQGQDTGWNDTGGNSRLRRWRIRNIHTPVAGTGDNITFTAVKVSWTATVGTPTLRTVRVAGAGSPVIPFGTYASGTTVTFTSPVTLTVGNVWTGNNNYLEWNGTGADVDSISNVRVQWTFQDDSTTEDSKSYEMTYWNGPQSGPGSGPPTYHIFTITSTGQVNQSGGKAFKVLETIKSTVSRTPADLIEIINWEKMDKNIP
jgi:Tfp pilus assembly protein PilX